MSAFRVPVEPVDATQALNLSAGVSNYKVSRVVVRLADEQLCSFRLASAPTMHLCDRDQAQG